MTPFQAELLRNPISSDEDFQKAWNNPRRFNLTASNLVVLITTVAANDNDVLKWTTSVRLYHRKKKRLKPVQLWSATERMQAMKMLIHELETVGEVETEELYESEKAIHLTRKVTVQDRVLVVRADEIMKVPTNGHRARISSPEDARRLLDKLEKDFEKE